MSSSPVPLKTALVGERCTLNMSRAQTYSCWSDVVVKRGQLKYRPRHLTMVLNYEDKTHLESKLDTLKNLRIKLSDIRNEYYEVVADDSDLEPLESEILDLEDDCEENIQTNNATAFPSERIYKTKSLLAKLDPANCVICKQQSHPVFRCKKFNDLSVNERFNSVKRNNLCINCFSSSHKVALCKSSRNCPNCSKRHNSLLYRNFERNVDSQRSPGSETLPNMEPRITTSTLNVNSECFQPKQNRLKTEGNLWYILRVIQLCS
ncbi:hypothetical protein TNCV_1646711 [Trichonephila clavipes]|nr:hypothetical protein TNCV_1646711 [Trichonephila clavipes]